MEHFYYEYGQTDCLNSYYPDMSHSIIGSQREQLKSACSVIIKSPFLLFWLFSIMNLDR